MQRKQTNQIIHCVVLFRKADQSIMSMVVSAENQHDLDSELDIYETIFDAKLIAQLSREAASDLHHALGNAISQLHTQH